MGYYRHKAVIFTYDYDGKHLAEVNDFITSLRQRILEVDPDIGNLILESDMVANGYRTYIFVPDGYKCGRPIPEKLQELREEFMKRFPGSILINFGGDDPDDIYLTRNDKNYYVGEE